MVVSPVVVQTDSGLRYQELRPGVGPRPGASDKVRVQYAGWLTDGTKFDSSVDRGEPFGFAGRSALAELDDVATTCGRVGPVERKRVQRKVQQARRRK